MNIKDLYQKVAAFEAGINPEATSLSQCRAGCSRCCYVDLSIFEVEAENILAWFSDLNPEHKSLLQETWKAGPTETLNFHGEVKASCTFLVNERCTIYEARPLICRTQGLALKFKQLTRTLVDICPLNDAVLEKMSDQDIVNLDLLNAILVQLNGMKGERKRLTELKEKLT